MRRRTAWPITLLVLLVAPVLAAPTAADTTPPSAPYFVSVKDVTETSVRVYWGPATDENGIETYVVYRDGQSLHEQPGNVHRAWTDGAVQPGTTYLYEVRAIDPSDNVGPPNDELVTTPGEPGPPPPPDPDAPVRGYATHIPHLTSGIPEYVGLAANGAANTIRDEAWWAKIEPEPSVYDWTLPDSIVRHAAERGLRALLMAYTTPTWASGASEGDENWFSTPPIDPADYGAFAGKLAERYGTGGTFWAENPELTETPLAGIEIWNEQNAAVFWGSQQPDAAHYTAMLQSAYTAIKAEDPSITVVIGGLASVGGYDDADCDGTPDGGVIADRVNPVRYLEQAYAAGAQGSFDAVGWHPYVFDFEGESTMPELLEYDECSTWSQMAETPVSARSLMVANGDGDKTVWVTEAGIPTCVFLALYPCVSRAEQAELLTTEFALWQTYDWAGGYIVYDLRDDCSSFLNVQCNFGVVTRGNNYKPAWVGLRTAWLNE